MFFIAVGYLHGLAGKVCCCHFSPMNGSDSLTFFRNGGKFLLASHF